MSGADETEIEDRTIVKSAGAGLCPCLLLGASTRGIDMKAHANAGRDIDGDVHGSTKVEPYGCRANEKAISNECGHTTYGDLQSPRPRKQAGSRAPTPEQCRNFV